MNYTRPQLRAIAVIDRNLQFIACAGSGKTVDLATAVVVSGRVDLIRRTDAGETAIVAFKSGEDTQPQEMTRL